MTDQCGPPIPVNGVRTEWLRDDDNMLVIWDSGVQSAAGGWSPNSVTSIDAWQRIVSIRLPITHPASICQKRALDHPDEAPFYPVHADGTVPVDYDGGGVLRRDGIVAIGSWPDPVSWRCKKGLSSDTVGYRRKATTAGPIPTCAPERFSGVVDDKARAQIAAIVGCAPAYHAQAARPAYDPTTHVLVERMTVKQWFAMLSAADPIAQFQIWFHAKGIFKPDPDPIAEYAAKHGLDVEELRALKQTNATAHAISNGAQPCLTLRQSALCGQ